MTKEQVLNLLRIIIGTIMLAIIVFMGYPSTFCLIPYIIVGYDVIFEAFCKIIKFEPFDECFLMTIATFGAVFLAKINTGDYTEAAAVMLFYQIGEWFNDYSEEKTRRSIIELMDIRPDYANKEIDGQIVKVDPNEVNVGDIVIVYPGEKIPIDGIVVSGVSSINNSALTGESFPIDVGIDDKVYSGSVNISGELKIQTTTSFGEDTASKILELVENASNYKSKSEKFISKFAKIYTPIVCLLALLICAIPSIILGDFQTWLYRALSFLVISCPCALVISIPLTFFSGIGKASRNGILIKGSNYLEKISNIKYLVFDKTGTLTKGSFEVVKASENWLIGLAALCESSSSHPIAKSLKMAYGKPIDSGLVETYCEIPGCGIAAKIGGKIVICGNKKIVPNSESITDDGTIVYVSVDNEYKGYIVISDQIKENSKLALEKFSSIGIKKTFMLTGDNDKVARNVCNELDIDEYYSNLLPNDKVNKIEEIISDNSDGIVAFVGDGLNDAPVLMRADIGIAMGSSGTDAAIESADIVLMNDNIGNIIDAINISRKCLKIAKQNIIFAILFKVICLVLCALGIANMWLAIFADVGVMVIAVLNALRV